MISFSTKDELEMWLEERGVDTRTWGLSGAKQVRDLWREVTVGDARLQNKQPLRLVSVVQIVIRKGEKVLLESEQELGNGDRRWRNRPPSEKMRPGESVPETALRCLKEEIGVDSQQVSLEVSTLRQRKEVAESPSYPGLLTQYTFHVVEAEVQGLPDDDFWHENSAFGKGEDPVKRHHWTWRRAAF